MSGSFHLIDQPAYFRRDAPCGPDCAGPGICLLAPPPEHREEYALAICGSEVVRYRDDYAASGTAKPEWEKDWCRECIMLVCWNPREEQALRARGFLTEGEVEQAGMATIAAFRRRIHDEGHNRAWPRMLDEMRRRVPEEFPAPLAEWFRQVVAHLDSGGPRPCHWPEDAAAWETLTPGRDEGAPTATTGEESARRFGRRQA